LSQRLFRDSPDTFPQYEQPRRATESAAFACYNDPASIPPADEISTGLPT